MDPFISAWRSYDAMLLLLAWTASNSVSHDIFVKQMSVSDWCVSGQVLTPAILGRIATALENMTYALDGMTSKWQETQIPKLYRQACRFWTLDRAPDQMEC